MKCTRSADLTCLDWMEKSYAAIQCLSRFARRTLSRQKAAKGNYSVISRTIKEVGSENQLQRFKELAREAGADESPGALDRAFGPIDAKRIETKKPAKRRAKAK
jgi:hypothetical protein